MNLIFSTHIFFLGIAAGFLVTLSPFIYEWLGKRWNIRVEEFAIFPPLFGKPIIHKTIRHSTRYFIGLNWTATYVRYYGMDKNTEVDAIKPEDYPYTFYHQPFLRKLVIRSIPFLLTVVALLLTLYAVDTSQRITANAQDVALFVRKLFQTLFGDKAQWTEFRFYALNTIGNKNPLLFVFILWCLLVLFSQAYHLVSNGKNSDSKFVRVLQNIIQWGVFAVLIYLLFWKLLPFIHTFYSWGELIRYGFSYMLGTYLCGALMYMLRISTLPKKMH